MHITPVPFPSPPLDHPQLRTLHSNCNDAVTLFRERVTELRSHAAAPPGFAPHCYAAANGTGDPLLRSLLLLSCETMAAAARPSAPTLCESQLPALAAQLSEVVELAHVALFEVRVAVEAAGALARRAVLVTTTEVLDMSLGATVLKLLIRDRLAAAASEATCECFYVCSLVLLGGCVC